MLRRTKQLLFVFSAHGLADVMAFFELIHAVRYLTPRVVDLQDAAKRAHLVVDRTGRDAIGQALALVGPHVLGVEVTNQPATGLRFEVSNALSITR
ncbi:MAG: hypothetical protein ABSA70_10995 [Terriglobia bacterium]